MTDIMNNQLGFDALLDAADEDNRSRTFDRETAHLPAGIEEGLAFYRGLIDRHHAAMLAADVGTAMALRKEADRLALKLNGGNPGILAGPDAAGCVLEARTTAPCGEVPLWGQCGEFVVEVCGMAVRVTLQGMFGIGGSVFYWPGFEVRAVESERPFLSETGYRSFLGLHAEPEPMTPDAFVQALIEAYVTHELTGRLLPIAPRYRRKAAP